MKIIDNENTTLSLVTYPRNKNANIIITVDPDASPLNPSIIFTEFVIPLIQKMVKAIEIKQYDNKLSIPIIPIDVRDIFVRKINIIPDVIEHINLKDGVIFFVISSRNPEIIIGIEDIRINKYNGSSLALNIK